MPDFGQATRPLAWKNCAAYPCRCQAAASRLQARVAIALRYTYRLGVGFFEVDCRWGQGWGVNVRSCPPVSNHHALTQLFSKIQAKGPCTWQALYLRRAVGGAPTRESHWAPTPSLLPLLAAPLATHPRLHLRQPLPHTPPPSDLSLHIGIHSSHNHRIACPMSAAIRRP
jgi:hypothetical protein